MSGLFICLIAVLLLPFTMKIVEKNLEVFLLLMGIITVVVSNNFSVELLQDTLRSPILITIAVFVAAIGFRLCHRPFTFLVLKASDWLPFPLFIAFIVFWLGLLSSILTAIIAAIVLVSIVQVLQLDRSSEIRFVVLTCFSIGLGAVLTPIGEPLSTITTHKLQQSFFYLFHLLGNVILPMLVLFSIIAALFVKKPTQRLKNNASTAIESFGQICWRSVKIYFFVAALTLLGKGFEPFIEQYILPLHVNALFWVNSISAVLDNATLAAAEISITMEHHTIRTILLGLLISGGMLIPGNIPNIIAASKLSITSKEWAKIGLPIGIITMLGTFIFVILAI